MRNSHDQNFKIIFPPLRLAQLFIHGASPYPAGIGKYATATEHLNFHFVPPAVTDELFPWWNQRQLDFGSLEPNSTLQYPEFHMGYFWEKICLNYNSTASVSHGKQEAGCIYVNS